MQGRSRVDRVPSLRQPRVGANVESDHRGGKDTTDWVEGRTEACDVDGECAYIVWSQE